MSLYSREKQRAPGCNTTAVEEKRKEEYDQKCASKGGEKRKLTALTCINSSA
jgi:hypothetical protein